MATAALAKSKNSKTRLPPAVPGTVLLFPYDGSNLSRDLVAGLSVAALALPVGVAYTQRAGFNPAVGLDSSILPLASLGQRSSRLSAAVKAYLGREGDLSRHRS